MKTEKNICAVSDEEIIATLLQCKSLTETAEKLNVDRRTLYNRMNDKEFKAKYAEAKNEILRSSIYFFTEKAGKAIKIIADMMENENTNPAIRFQCAKYILDNVFEFTEKFENAEQDARKIRDPFLFDSIF